MSVGGKEEIYNMNDIRAIGAVIAVIGIFIIYNYILDKIEHRAAKTQHRERVKRYTCKRLRLMESNSDGLLDRPKSILKYKIPAEGKHRNTYFHSLECAAAYGGKYVPKGESI